jgi:2-phosphosulfolactate phosphatase
VSYTSSHPTIRLLRGAAHASEARGFIVVIDVFRAFSFACYAIGNGATDILAVRDLETAWAVKHQYPEYLLAGEQRGGRRPERFDFGNSPSAIESIDLTGRGVIHMTSSGTAALTRVRGDEILTGSFVNAGAVVRYIRQRLPSEISLLCTEDPDRGPWDEDTLCAEFIARSVLGEPTDFASVVTALKSHEHGRILLTRPTSDRPARDFSLCLALNRYDFVLLATHSESNVRRLLRRDV